MDNKELDFLALLKEQEKEHQDPAFTELVGGDIAPLKQDKIEVTTKVLDKTTAKIRQDAATRLPEDVTDSASSGFVHMVEPNEILEFRRPGVQPYVVQKLRKGEYPEADYIDLHGKTIEGAYNEVMKFIGFAKEHEFRCVLIIHGKGERSKPKALTKSHVAHWLKQLPDVLAFHSAPVWKGGTGAVCIILKKGDKASIINREMHQKR